MTQMEKSVMAIPAVTASDNGRIVRHRLLKPFGPKDLTGRNTLTTNSALALEAIWSNRLRSLLTALGIFIGVAAVITALTLTQGVSTSINNTISSLGTNVITISPGSGTNQRGFNTLTTSTTQSLTPLDITALTKVQHVTGVSGILSQTVQSVYGNQNWNTRVQGVNVSYQDIQNWSMSEGTWFSSSDDQAAHSVVLLGQTVSHNLFDASGDDPIGKTIRIRDQLYRVIGVLESKGGANSDDVIFMPLTTAIDRVKNTQYVDNIQVQVDDSSNINQVQQDITSILQLRHHITNGNPNDFNMTNSNQLLQTANQFTSTLTLLLVGVASISLTVGGVGIMNIMIVSVTERTREIGIRMSLGATRADIRNQFLIEALVLSLVGGIIGMVIGFSLSFAVTSLSGLPFVVTTTALIMPFGISSLIGVVFGLYPAVRASRLDPIDALRTV